MTNEGTSHQDVAPQYEQRLVLFLDILGFSDHVRRSTEDANHLSEIVGALQDIQDIGIEGGHSQRVTQFSDSLVLSYRVDEPSGVFWMLTEIAIAIMQLASRGFIVRGAITVGDLMHTDTLVLGPALVRAHELEKNEACYPRVIIDQGVIDVAREHHNPDHDSASEEQFVRESLTEDDDGYLFIDYFSWEAIVGTLDEDEDFPIIMDALSQVIAEGLKADDPRVVEKHLWMQARLVEAVEAVIDGLGTIYPEEYSIVKNIPLHKEAARAAKARIESEGPQSVSPT